VIAWQFSNTLDGLFCLEVLQSALQQGKPEIFNIGQGAHFTAQAFTSELEVAGVLVSMDGRGRAYDNIFIERLWRTIKYEDNISRITHRLWSYRKAWRIIYGCIIMKDLIKDWVTGPLQKSTA
jgi:transposase InsO family protein